MFTAGEGSPPERSGRGSGHLAWVVSGVATVVWLGLAVGFGLLDRVADNWRSALTMLGGSFLAGSSPEGGGAVAFPVFTKALHVPGSVARTFGLCIQAVGMSMAVLAIVLHRRAVHWRSAAIGSAGAVVGFLTAVALWGDGGAVFWPMSIGTPWVKATFSIVLATTSVLMIRHLRTDHMPGDGGAHRVTEVRWSSRADTAVATVAVAGGVLSSLTGTGANILIFLLLMVVLGIDPKVALPTAIVVMAVVSVVGLFLFGVMDGQLNVDLVGDRVVAVGGQAFEGAASEVDLFGLWFAAVPVVVWGAPLGSFVAHHVPESWLIRFVAMLAAVEVATTLILVDELRSDSALIAYLAAGLVVLPMVFIGLARGRHRIFETGPDTRASGATAARKPPAGQSGTGGRRQPAGHRRRRGV